MSAPKCNEKSREIASLLGVLDTALMDGTISEERHLTIVEQLKTLGRDAQDAEAIFTKESISILASIGLNYGSSNLSREALRCIANALLLKPEARQTFANLDYINKAAEKLKTNRNDDEFLHSRILFLLTYGTSMDFHDLIVNHGLAEAVVENIERHTELWNERQSNDNARGSVEEELAFSETLKLLFNLMHNQPLLEKFFTPCLPSIMCCLRFRISRQQASLQPPNNHLINAILSFDLPEEIVFPDVDPVQNVNALVSVLDFATVDYNERSLDTTVAPLLTLIRRVYEVAPEAVRSYAQKLLLPSELEREHPLGKTTSLSSRLLRLSSSPNMPGTRDLISSLLFELSGKNTEKFIQNVGYGHAAGYLASHNIPVPVAPRFSNEESSHETMGKAGNPTERSREVNMVTGQYLDRETTTMESQMTEEEKLVEAERLFVLFERLRKTGVIEVQSPIRTAIESGRFKEVE